VTEVLYAFTLCLVGLLFIYCNKCLLCCGDRIWGVGLVGRMNSVISVHAWSLWVLRDENYAVDFRLQ